MAVVQIATQQLSKNAIAPTFTTLNAVDTYYTPNNSRKTVFYFKNTNAGIATITLDVTQLVDSLTLADHSFTIPATTGERFIGALPTKMEVSGGTEAGKIKFACDLATGVSVAAFQG